MKNKLFLLMLVTVFLFVIFFQISCGHDYTKTANIYFVSYGNDRFKNSRERIKNEASATGWFKDVKIYTENDFDQEFLDKHKIFMNNSPRGGGYWIWKPYYILKYLQNLKDGDFLVYLDAGSTINDQGKNRLNFYLSVLDKHSSGVLGFQMKYIEKCWTKADLADYLDVLSDESIMNGGQVMATGAIFQKNPNSMAFVKQWYELATIDNYHLVDDSQSKIDNDGCFEEHRHDQSIFSLLIKKAKAPLLGDELQYFSSSRPFRATRKRD